MKDFKKGGGGFKKSFGGGGGNRFGGGGRPGGRDFKEMYSTTCADCGNSCEVPFRPTGERPVYCRDCFANNPPAPAFDRGAKKPFNKFGGDRGGRPPFKPSREAAPVRPSGADNSEVVRQLQTLNSKIDRLIQAMETKHDKREPAPIKVVAEAVAKTTSKKVAKKAAPKKVVSKKKPAAKKKSKK